MTTRGQTSQSLAKNCSSTVSVHAAFRQFLLDREGALYRLPSARTRACGRA